MMHYHKEQIVNMEKHLRTAFVNSLSGFKSYILLGLKTLMEKLIWLFLIQLFISVRNLL